MELLNRAVDQLRHVAEPGILTSALLVRTLGRSLSGFQTDRASASNDLDEAWNITTGVSMRLALADIHLHRARLFHALKPYPWNKFADGKEGRGPRDDLADARKLIEQCGYWRRKEELENAEEAAKNW